MDKLMRLLVYLGVVVGLLYNVLWYFFVLMLVVGVVVVVWDFRWLYGLVLWVVSKVKKGKVRDEEREVELRE